MRFHNISHEGEGMKNGNRDEVDLELVDYGDQYVFNIIFVNTGEIRQKRRSKEWMLKRIWQHEINTWRKNDRSEIEVVK